MFQSVRAVRSNCNLKVLVFEEREKLRNALRKATDSEQEREPYVPVKGTAFTPI